MPGTATSPGQFDQKPGFGIYCLCTWEGLGSLTVIVNRNQVHQKPVRKLAVF